MCQSYVPVSLQRYRQKQVCTTVTAATVKATTYSDQQMLFLHLFISFFTSLESMEVVLNSRFCRNAMQFIWSLSSELPNAKLVTWNGSPEFSDGAGHQYVSCCCLIMHLLCICITTMLYTRHTRGVSMNKRTWCVGKCCDWWWSCILTVERRLLPQQFLWPTLS